MTPSAATSKSAVLQCHAFRRVEYRAVTRVYNHDFVGAGIIIDDLECVHKVSLNLRKLTAGHPFVATCLILYGT